VTHRQTMLFHLQQQATSTPWAIKRCQLIFFCNFVKNQRMLMQFSLLDLQMNITWPSPTSPN